jgi:enoyl-CoA hydratase
MVKLTTGTAGDFYMNVAKSGSGSFSPLLINGSGGIRRVIINRPDKLNVLDLGVIEGLEKAVRTLSAEKSCRVVIISGSGGRAFCAGADIKYLLQLANSGSTGRFADRIHRLYSAIESMKKPVIAAIDGYCLGGGCELALACDIRIATPDSKFGQPEVKIGIVPGGGGTVRLPEVVGPAAAKELILTGRTIDAKEALRIGLISRVVKKGMLDQEATSVAREIMGNSYNAVVQAKTAIKHAGKASYEAEKKAFVSCFNNKDSAEGMRAFLGHRKPKFV